MKPSNEIIEKFQKIYFEEFGEEISKKEAYDHFISPVDLLRVILQSVKKQGQDYENPGSVSHGEQYPSILQFLDLLAWGAKSFSGCNPIALCKGPPSR